MKFTSKQINALSEITADTDEPIEISQEKKNRSLRVKIGKGKRAVKWLVKDDGYSIPVAPPLKGMPVDPKPLAEPQTTG